MFTSISLEFQGIFLSILLSIRTLRFLPLSRYIDAVKPGQYGVPRPLYFPFLPSYWTGKSRGRKVSLVLSWSVRNAIWCIIIVIIIIIFIVISII